jgi:hypothetical protein
MALDLEHRTIGEESDRMLGADPSRLHNERCRRLSVLFRIEIEQSTFQDCRPGSTRPGQVVCSPAASVAVMAG